MRTVRLAQGTIGFDVQRSIIATETIFHMQRGKREVQ